MPNSHNPRGVKASAKGLKQLAQAKADGRDDDGKPLTYERIALAAGVNDRTVRRFMKGAAVDTDTAYPVCKVLKVDPDEILKPSQEWTVPGHCGKKGANPFNYGSPVEPDRFYGRWSARSDIKNRIGAKTAQSINIVGLRRMGKTSLLHYVQKRIHEFCLPEQKPLVVSLDFQNPKFHSPQGIIEGVRREIKDATKQLLWTCEENNDAFAIEDGLMNLRNQGYRLIVMIDEFEGIAKRLETFQDWGEDWRAKTNAGLLTLVMATKRPLNEIYEPLQLTSPFHNIFSTTVLGAMAPEEWQPLVKDGVETQVSDDVLSWIGRLAGGWPFLVQMAASLLWQYSGDLEKAESEFRIQAKPHFQSWWDSLSNGERVTLKVVVKQQIPHSAMLERFQRYGLVTAEQDYFSCIFADWIRAQRP